MCIMIKNCYVYVVCLFFLFVVSFFSVCLFPFYACWASSKASGPWYLSLSKTILHGAHAPLLLAENMGRVRGR